MLEDLHATKIREIGRQLPGADVLPFLNTDITSEKRDSVTANSEPICGHFEDRVQKAIQINSISCLSEIAKQYPPPF